MRQLPAYVTFIDRLRAPHISNRLGEKMRSGFGFHKASDDRWTRTNRPNSATTRLYSLNYCPSSVPSFVGNARPSIACTPRKVDFCNSKHDRWPLQGRYGWFIPFLRSYVSISDPPSLFFRFPRSEHTAYSHNHWPTGILCKFWSAFHAVGLVKPEPLLSRSVFTGAG